MSTLGTATFFVAANPHFWIYAALGAMDISQAGFAIRRREYHEAGEHAIRGILHLVLSLV